MRAVEMWSLYLLVGFGAAVALHLKTQIGKLDFMLLVPFWPLYGPLLLASGRHEGLTGLLPETTLREKLTGRLNSVRARVFDLDRLLSDPAFSAASAARREEELSNAGDLRAAASARARRHNIERLDRLRERYRRELVEVEELMAQLEVQTEVVRRLGGREEESQDLMIEISARIDGLDAILAEEDLAA